MTAEELLHASWHDTPTTRAIVDFVADVCDPRRPGFVVPAARVAVFDNDGTLWCEQPMPIQLDFVLRRLAAMVDVEPNLRRRQPWRAASERDLAWFGQAIVDHYHGDDAKLRQLAEAAPHAFADHSVERFEADVLAFFAQAEHPTLGRRYLDCAYRPMIDLVRFLEANQFVVYIASGGDRDFMRPVTERLYGVPPERIIGSSLALEYHEAHGDPGLRYRPRLDVFDDGPIKPVRIWSRAGRRPVLAVGNSNGDAEMLRFARRFAAPGLRLVVRHDDARREFDDQRGAEQVLAEAHAAGWPIISIRDDWRTVFGPS